MNAYLPSVFLASCALVPNVLASDEPVDLVRDAHGVSVVDGELWGIGWGYKIHFARDGVEFTPALGEAASRNYPLRFRLETIQREGTEFPGGGKPILDAAPQQSGNVVSYSRGGGVTEVFEVRARAVEQSFRFVERPEGSGDLIVRGSFDTELTATLTDGGRGGVSFELPGVGGFELGKVVGIDANGRRVDGLVRLNGARLEYVLPGEFVDQAVYPMILDPELGNVFTISGVRDLDPDVAYDVTNQLYAVTWEQKFSAPDVDIRLQRVDTAATPVGFAEAISIATTAEINAVVANVNASNRFPRRLAAGERVTVRSMEHHGKVARCHDGLDVERRYRRYGARAGSGRRGRGNACR